MRLLLCLVAFFGFVTAWSGNDKQLCSRTRRKFQWQWGCKNHTWSGCAAWGWINVEVTYREYFCCSGWRHNGNQVCNIPICPYDCGGAQKGTCSSPDVCNCKPGYRGTYCTSVADCSHLKPCYPGYCTIDGCMCTNNFYPENSGSSNCLTFPTANSYYPSIEQSTFNLGYFHPVKKILIYNMTIDSAMSTNNSEIFWANRRVGNRMNFTFQSIFSLRFLNLTDKPDYIIRYALGITEADIGVAVTDFNGNNKYARTLTCDGISSINPKYDMPYRCNKSIDDFNMHFDSGDTLAVTFRVKNGGYRILDNGGETQNYTGRQTSRRVELKFDTETPYHCSQKNECSDTSTMMSIQKDVTKDPIHISWSGWNDTLSKVARYTLEVFKLVKAGDGTLKEPYTDRAPYRVPLNITEFNETTVGAAHSFTFQPTEPGVYSWILEVNDKANNSVYARRFVIYDPSSIVTSDSLHRLYATSISAESSDLKWQSENPQTVSFSWKNHFLNKVHETGDFLASIRHFPESDTDGEYQDGYKAISEANDDTEGTRTRASIPNERGIIKYDVGYSANRNLNTPHTYQYTGHTKASIEISLSEQLQDGNFLTLWVKAYDILNNTKEEMCILFYDSSRPTGATVELQTNMESEDMNLNSRVLIQGASDPHSGIKRIKYRFRALSTGSLVNDKEYEYTNPQRDQMYCNTNPCDENLPTGESFGRTIDIIFSNCFANNVSHVFNETISIEIDIINSAGLFIQRSVQLTNLTSLKGVNDYFGPVNIRTTYVNETSYKIMWDTPSSCYTNQGFHMIHSKTNGHILQNTTSYGLQNWLLLDNVENNTMHVVQLYILYGNDRIDLIRSVPSTFTFGLGQEAQVLHGAAYMHEFRKIIGAFLVALLLLW